MNTFDKIVYTIFFIIAAVLLIKFVVGLVLVGLALVWLRTWQMKKEPHQHEFLEGRLPNPRPDGLYKGETGFDSSWVGKKFNAQNSTGINLFARHKSAPGKTGHSIVPGFTQEVQKYPFVTSVGKGLFDHNTIVLKIDYNIAGNPFWIRWVLDEIVEISPDHYLGKVHLRIIPGLPFSVLYFELKK